LFVLGVLGALTITLLSVPMAAKLIAGAVVVPIVAVALLLLLFERRGRLWAFAAAAVLGALGVALRLVVSTEPSLEVGGGLPVEVNIAYIALGLSVVATNLWAYLSSRANAEELPKPASR
jgi:ABC-type cobalamin transport system permease subunit